MEIKEIKDAIDEASKALKDGVTDAKALAKKALDDAKEMIKSLEGKADASALEDLKKSFDDEKKELQKEIDALGVKIKNAGIVEGQINSVMSQIKAQFFEKATDLAAVASKASGSVRFDVKAATDPISVTSFGDRVIFGLREPGVDRVPLPERFVFDIIQVMNGGPGSNPLSWVEMVPGAGAPAWVAESAIKPAMNWTYVERKVTAEMIAVYTVVTKQALLNWPILEQEIRGELSRKLYNKLDQAVINGDGTANSIFGINYYATDFDAGSLAGTVTDANRMDVIRVAIGQVRKGAADADPELGGFNANYVLVSQDTSTSMDIAKNLNGTYLLPPFTSQDNTVIKGVEVIATNFIGDDDFIVGDFSRYLFNIVDGLKIDIGYINEQFIHNQLTIRAELYGMGRVKNNEKPAFVKGTFADAIAELEATT